MQKPKFMTLMVNHTWHAKEIDSMEDFLEAEAFLRLEEGGEKWSKY